MMRIMFFVLGIPAMILSFFEVVDIMPYVAQSSLIFDGEEIVLSEQQQESLEQQVLQMFETAHTLPAFGVINPDEFENYLKQGKFVSLKFDSTIELNGLPFDELVFEVSPELQAFNLFRGNKGVFQGRCIYIDLMGGAMEELSNLINDFNLSENSPKVENEEQVNEIENNVGDNSENLI